MKKVINQGQFKRMSSEAVTARRGEGQLRCYLAFLGLRLMKDREGSAKLIDSKSLFVLLLLLFLNLFTRYPFPYDDWQSGEN